MPHAGSESLNPHQRGKAGWGMVMILRGISGCTSGFAEKSAYRTCVTVAKKEQAQAQESPRLAGGLGEPGQWGKGL